MKLKIKKPMPLSLEEWGLPSIFKIKQEIDIESNAILDRLDTTIGDWSTKYEKKIRQALEVIFDELLRDRTEVFMSTDRKGRLVVEIEVGCDDCSLWSAQLNVDPDYMCAEWDMDRRSALAKALRKLAADIDPATPPKKPRAKKSSESSAEPSA